MTRIILLIPLLAVLLSCGQVTQPGDGSQPNATSQVSTDVGGQQPAAQPSVAQPPPMVAAPPPPPAAAAIPLPEAGDLLLEEKIIIYNTIVQATMASTTSEVVVASDPYHSGVDNRYRTVLKFNLTVHEYLKGSGPTNITAIWLDGITYTTNAQAESARAAIVQSRDTQWDDARAVVFLVGNHRGRVETFGTVLSELLHRSDHFYFSSAARYYHNDDRYSLYSRSRVLWFPEERPGIADGAYMMTPPPNPQIVSLSNLKQTIAAVAAELASDDSEEYRECVVKKYEHMRHERNWPSGRGREFTLWDLAHAIESGRPAGTEIDRRDFRNAYPDPAPTWLEGTDSAAFSVWTGTSTTAGFEQAEITSTARPLPGGEYSFDIKESWPEDRPCNYVVSNEVTVTVTAGGALHEFFFDPVTVGRTIGADSTNSVLNPASFTGADGTTSTISSMAWEPSTTRSGPTSGSVKVDVAATDLDEALSDHVLDFIELDGTVSLSLDVFDATVETRPASGSGIQTHTLSWTVSSQPWESGDELMVRIR